MTKFKVICPECGEVECYKTLYGDCWCSQCNHICEVVDLGSPAWTPVEDGLPEESGKYLCYARGGAIIVLNFGEDNYFYSIPHVPFDYIIAWQPPPAPYVPPVKLRESCEGCEYLDVLQFRSGGKISNNVDHCSKHGICGCTAPFLHNNKPCHED